MKTRTTIMLLVCTAFLLILRNTPAFAQQSANSQRLLLSVAELNALSVPAEILAVERAAAGEAVSTIVWTSNGGEKKITVAKRSSNFAEIKISVPNIDHRTSASRSVELRGSAHIDLLYGLGRSAGNCVLEFTLIPAYPAARSPVLIVYTVTNS